MTPAEALRALCALQSDLPEGVAITVPLAWLSTALGANGSAGKPSAESLQGADWTVAQLAKRFGRQPSTVRAWIGSGRLRGYLFGHREWRVSQEALREFEEAERQREAGRREPTPVARRKAVDLSAWRQTG